MNKEKQIPKLSKTAVIRSLSDDYLLIWKRKMKN